MKLSLAQIRLWHFQQTHYYWLYCWSRSKDGDVYVQDQISKDRFLWVPR